MLIAAGLAGEAAIVAQGRAAIVDALRENGAQRFEQIVRPRPTHAPRPGVDAGAPQGLVGVDIADARDGTLRKQLRLDPLAALAQGAVELARREAGVEGIGTERVQRR